MDFSCKIYEEMARALIVSVLPSSQISFASSLFTAVSGTGSAAGYLFGSLSLGVYVLYFCGIATFVPCSMISLFAAGETRFVETKEQKLAKAVESKGLWQLLETLTSFSWMFYYLVLTQLIGWSVYALLWRRSIYVVF